MMQWFYPSQHPTSFALLIVAAGVIMSFLKIGYDRFQFRRHSRPRILAVLRKGPLSEQEILERDHDISSHGVIDPDLYKMEKEREISSRTRTDGVREFLLNEEPAAKTASPSTEVAS